MRVLRGRLAVTATAVLAAACWPCPTCPPGPTTVVIDFEHFPGPDGRLGTPDDVTPPTTTGSGAPCPPSLCLIRNVSNEWSSVGVVFTRGTLFYDTQGFGAQAGFGKYFLSSLPVEARLSVPVYGIEITSYSGWNAKLTAYDAADRVLGVANLWHPPGSAFHGGTLRLCTREPIARFAVIEQSDNASLILNLDRLVLTTSAP
jgi:hypothetical protein